MQVSSPPSMGRRALRWALVLGAVGFAAGFFGPMVLAPESNIGPIIGILFTGPGGFVAGLVLGAIVGMLPLSEARKAQALAGASVVLGLGTLYFCLPEPAVRGYIIDARVEGCTPPARLVESAVARWEQAVARVTWAAPTPNWKATAIATVEHDPGLVLDVRIERKRPILRHRRPWDRNRSSAGAWQSANEVKQYYVGDDPSACAAYVARDRQLYWPAVDPGADAPQPAKIWPPTDTLGFLQLQTLEPVPPEYRALLRP